MSSAATLPNNWNLDSSRLLFFPETKRESENSSGLDQELLRGRLTELSGAQHSAQMSLVAHWIRQVQEQGQVAAWVHCPPCLLYPPDLADAGIDLDRLLVVHVPAPHAITRAGDLLLRSGALGLLLLDMRQQRPADRGWTNRLLSLAHKHESRVVCLTSSPQNRDSLSSLVGLRVEARLAWEEKSEGGHFSLSMVVLKDKRGNPQRRFEEVCRGPLGLR